MEPKIGSLSIKRFRALREINISPLGRVNLITGRNNAGKSSILEALRLLASNASPAVIFDILRYREEAEDISAESSRRFDLEGAFPISSLFHGFPELSKKLEPVEIKSNGSQRPMELSFEIGWFPEVRTPEGTSRLDTQATLFDEEDAVAALKISSGGDSRVVRLDSYGRNAYRARPFRMESSDESRLNCIFVSAYGGERTGTLGSMWDKIALSDHEEHVVDALRIIDPNISAISMVGGESPGRSRTAIVKSQALARPVPLRSFGDGLNRLFGIVLSLVNAKDGLLLIDEFENGMHFSIQTDTWRTIFKLANRLNVQVMATSHSWDAIESFQRAASESPEDGVLIRLSRKGDDIIPTIFREDELTIATRERIEVR
ncbi:MAG: AAA family ATPase [Candidatus Hydrogenedentes bacterium]|nr:AAA family ATPase [Candidatus Hydrogenedentota bacterium]